ncbi:MAG: hypothetical protein V4664_00390 [Patescibacteria group bacterium]
MNTQPKNSKLEYCKDELKALLNKLVEGNYHITAEFLYDHIANSGVDMKIHPELENQKTMYQFLEEN